MLLSRVADSLFWMSRYVERAENTARFLDVHQNLSLGEEESTGQWAPLVAITGDLPQFEERYGAPTRDNVLRFLVFDEEYPNSIRSCVRAARENARTIRETISVPLWEELNGFYLDVDTAARNRQTLRNPINFLKRVRTTSHALAGIADSTMSHDESWHFVRMGRLLERADKTSRILDVKYFVLLPDIHDVGSELDTIQWAALLRSASALHMYRRTYGRLKPATVAKYLLLERQFPRSVRYCVAEANESLHAISGSPQGMFGNRAEQLLGRLRSDLDFSHIEDIISGGLHEFIDALQARLNVVGDAIFETFFAVPPAEAE